MQPGGASGRCKGKNTMKQVHHRIAFALSALGLALLLGGCGGKSDVTAGQKLDSAVAKTEVLGTQAAAELKDAGEKAAAVTEQAAQKMTEQLEDAAISLKVTTGLAADKNLSALKIKVESRDGVVTLRGPA